MGVPSILSIIRKVADLERVRTTLDFNWVEQVTRRCNLPDVLGTADIKETTVGGLLL
jgi:hypothetical protein